MITDFSVENELLQILEKDYPGVKVITDVGDSSWGRLILPGKETEEKGNTKPLKLVLITSYILGYIVLETVKKIAEVNPGKLKIAGVVTDDPVDPNAKISVRRRIWRKYGPEESIYLENGIIESAIADDIPVFTGAVKTDYFRSLLRQWDPDAILVAVFGQIIDSPVIHYPKMGIYNFHPADLKSGFGAGPQPFQDLIDRDAKTSKFTIHELSEQLDSGPVIGQSAPINIRYADGSISDDILVLQDKMLEPVVPMTYELVKTLILKNEEGMIEKVKKIDFSRHFNEEMKNRLLEPVVENKPKVRLPEYKIADDFRI